MEGTEEGENGSTTMGEEDDGRLSPRNCDEESGERLAEQRAAWSLMDLIPRRAPLYSGTICIKRFYRRGPATCCSDPKTLFASLFFETTNRC